MNEQTQSVTDHQPPKLAFSAQEAAQSIGVSVETVRRLIKRGHLKCCTALRHKVIPRAELERFLRDSMKETA